MPRLRSAVVLRVSEDTCTAWTGAEVGTYRFAPQFPSPRTERVSPGHAVAVADDAVVVWRWYDAVVLLGHDAGSVRLWEPAHGEVAARPRASYQEQEPGSRAYASAGLPGADWWVAGARAAVELDAVATMYADLWPAVFGA
jgi:hypothetical protein